MTIRSLISKGIILNPLILFLVGFKLLCEYRTTFRMGSISNGTLVGFSTPNQTNSQQNNDNTFHNTDFTTKLYING